MYPNVDFFSASRSKCGPLLKTSETDLKRLTTPVDEAHLTLNAARLPSHVLYFLHETCTYICWSYRNAGVHEALGSSRGFILSNVSFLYPNHRQRCAVIHVGTIKTSKLVKVVCQTANGNSRLPIHATCIATYRIIYIPNACAQAVLSIVSCLYV